MNKTIVKILIALIILFLFITIGIPFEIENQITDVILRLTSFILVFLIIYFLFNQVKKIKTPTFRITFKIVFSLLTLLFVLGAIWNDIFRSNDHGNWYNLEVYTSKSGTKVLKQIRETSGSIYDYRYRLVLYEFDEENRISINTNANYIDETWNVLNVKNE